MKLLQYDYSFMMTDAVGETGTSEVALSHIQNKLLSFRRSAFVNPQLPLGFMELPKDAATADIVKEKAQFYREHFDTLIVLGIGGSDLGARAAISALRSPFANFTKSDQGMRVFFLGGNTDPDEIENVLGLIDWTKTVINVISKSGDTVETMSTFIYLREVLINAVGREAHSRHIVATTDLTKGTLRTIVNREGYDSLIVPDSVGGRFSVLSAVGLFPIACAGLDIDALLKGAAELAEVYRSDSDQLKAAELFAAFHYIGLTEKKQNVHVLVPYAAQLKETGFWFRQLWAESLGKRENLAGEEVYVGPTPVAALGATDQHSQFQLYYHGPFDKIFTFIQVEKFSTEITVPEAFSDIEGISYMSGISFNDVINTELKGSALALSERGRPNGRLIIPELSPYYLGQLFQFFEIATAYMGELLSINAYDQPAVELGKHNVYALLHRKGFERRETELDNLMLKYNKRVV
ncbi:MAG: glucose-6-phosphate isomerase [bacterium]|nr:glucose-6-phosphate isomerase [bacterium]